jgi:Rv2632c-like/Domain of unknown function (DUF1918)
MQIKAGDRIEVTTNTLGVAPRRGAVLEAMGSGGLRVQWDDGHESMFMPGSNCRVMSSEADGSNTQVRLGCHIDIAITEDDTQCMATARVVTSQGFFEGHGVARRKPGDPQIPLIGEELAIGRALRVLSDQLMAAATEQIATKPATQDHLVR